MSTVNGSIMVSGSMNVTFTDFGINMLLADRIRAITPTFADENKPKGLSPAQVLRDFNTAKGFKARKEFWR